MDGRKLSHQTRYNIISKTCIENDIVFDQLKNGIQRKDIGGQSRFYVMDTFHWQHCGIDSYDENACTCTQQVLISTLLQGYILC